MRGSGRRAFLRGIGVAGVAGLAGCSWLGSGDEGSPTDVRESGGDSQSANQSTIERSVGGAPTPRYDAARTGYAPEESGPTEPVSAAWQTDRQVGGFPFYRPNVVGDTIYIACEDARLYALSLDGSKRWHVDLNGRPSYKFTPGVGDETIVVGTETGDVHGIGLQEGSQRWLYQVDDSVQGPAAVNDGIAFVVDFSGTLHALATADGSEQWTASLGTEAGAGAVVSDGNVYAGGTDGFSAHSIEDGSVLWTENASPETRPIIERGTVAFGENGNVVCLDAASGSRRWRQTVAGDAVQSLTLGGDVIVAGSSDRTATEFSGLSIDDGSVKWTKEDRGAGVASIVIDDTVFGARQDFDSFLFAMDIDDGETLVERKVPSTVFGFDFHEGALYAGTRGGFVSEVSTGDLSQGWRFGSRGQYPEVPAVVDEVVYVGTVAPAGGESAEIVALSARDGSELWSTDVESSIATGGTTVADGTVVAVTRNGLTALSVDDGSAIWSEDIDGAIIGAPTVVNGSVYVAPGGHVSSYALEDGTAEWRSSIANYSYGQVAAHGEDRVVYAIGGRRTSPPGDVLYALDSRSGGEIWHVKGAFNLGPVITDDHVYVATTREVVAFDRAEGTEQWRTPLETGETHQYHALAASDRRVIVTSRQGRSGHIDGYTAGGGTHDWRFSIDSVVTGSPVIVGDLVYFTDYDRNLWALSAEDGNELWRQPFDEYVAMPFTVVDDVVFLGGVGLTALTEGQ